MVCKQKPKMTQYNNSNVPFELHIRKNSTISNLGKYELLNALNLKSEPTELCDVLNNSANYLSKSVCFSL